MDVDLITPNGDVSSLLGRAQALLDARDIEPIDALAQADAIVRAARSPRHREARALAHRAGCLALLDLGRVPQAARRSERGVADARAARVPSTVAGCLTTAAALAALVGRRKESFAMIDEAVIVARDAGDVVSEMNASAQRSWMMQRAGRWRDALRGVEALVDRPVIIGPFASEAQVRGLRAESMADRANILAELSRYDEALVAFDQAIDEIRRWPGPLDVVEVQRNRGVCLTHAGRIPDAMRAFDEVAESLAGSPAHRLRHLVGHADLLLDAQLIDEALVITERATAISRRAVRTDLWAEAHLLRARALRAGGDHSAAVIAARVAAKEYHRLGVAGRAAVARMIAASATAPRRRVGELDAAAVDLHRAGLRDEAIAARVAALMAAVAVGDHRSAEHQHRVVAVALRAGPALTRARAWLAEAVWHEFGDRPVEAREAVVTGLDILDEYRASLGGTELRAHASRIGEELVRIGIGLALHRDHPADVLWMSERWRSGVVQRRPVTTAAIAETMAELRHVLIEIGQPDIPAGALAELDTRRAALEDQVRQRARRIRGGGTRAVRPTRVSELRRVLDGGTLIEIVLHDDRYFAVTVAATTTIVELCAASEPLEPLADLLFALRRMARRGVSASAASAARDAATQALADIDRLLLEPLIGRVGAGHVVLVPPGPLHAVPWPSLASLHGRVVTVSPSSTWWAAAARVDELGHGGDHGLDHTGGHGGDHGLDHGGGHGLGHGGGQVVLAAGPRLRGATDEIAQLGSLYPDAIALEGDLAVEGQLRAALDGASLAHIACHSRPRADHPHLSALEMTDGPFTVYDFERLGSAPRQVVLSACESGVSAVRPGEELLGFLSALFSLGTDAVLASVVPVPDLATTSFMVAFHERLRAGQSFPLALAETRRELLATSNDPADFVVAHAFVAFANVSSMGSAVG